jgi:hypothetical protein
VRGRFRGEGVDLAEDDPLGGCEGAWAIDESQISS